jgi:hypothetical protein
MAYLVEINTAAGLVIFGSFATLDDAKQYAAGLGVIRPLFPPAIPTAELVAFTLKELQTKLDTL